MNWSRLYSWFPGNHFLIGAGSCFDLFGNYYDYDFSYNPLEEDRKALRKDWEIVGDDLHRAMNCVKLD
jgi:hypothetical protein